MTDTYTADPRTLSTDPKIAAAQLSIRIERAEKARAEQHEVNAAGFRSPVPALPAQSEGVMSTVRRFDNTGEEFSGIYAAEAWCRKHGYATGSSQRGTPAGVHRDPDDEICISKWRNMTEKEQASLDGHLTTENGSHYCDFRAGDVILTLREAAS